jgi:hypothetical protein
MEMPEHGRLIGCSATIGNSPAKRDIADRVDFRVCPSPSPRRAESSSAE